MFNPRVPLSSEDVARSTSTRVIVLAALLAITTFAAHLHSLGGAFVFDDFPAIRDNPTIRKLTELGAVLSPPAASGVGGRPIANLSFALNYAAGGIAVRG